MTIAPEAPATSPAPAPLRPDRWAAVRRWLGAHVRRPRGTRAVRLGLLLVLAVLVGLGVAGARALRPVHDGTLVPLTSVMQAAAKHQVVDAVLYDQDARVVVQVPGDTWVASYTRSDSETSALVRALAGSGPVKVNPQTGKQLVRLGLQFLRRAWFNLDRVWGASLALAGAAGIRMAL